MTATQRVLHCLKIHLDSRLYLLKYVFHLTFVFSITLQFQKQGKDVEKVKQRLAEIANYVDKVLNAILCLNEWDT